MAFIFIIISIVDKEFYSMNKDEILSQCVDLVKDKFEGEGTGHGWWHINRVYLAAEKIAKEEKANLFVVRMGALLHDIADHKFNNGDDSVGPKEARRILIELNCCEEDREAIVQIVDQVTYKGAGVPTPMSSLEGKCVQDADRLDALGAIGIARTFAYGGSKSREIYNPNVKPELHDSFEKYKSTTAPTINHFYEKLLLLKDLMNTKTGKRLANERHVFMEGFLEQFYAEWDVER